MFEHVLPSRQKLEAKSRQIVTLFMRYIHAHIWLFKGSTYTVALMTLFMGILQIETIGIFA